MSSKNIRPISYSFSYSEASAQETAHTKGNTYELVIKQIKCDKQLNIYKNNTNNAMVYYCPSSKYDYMMVHIRFHLIQ